MSNIAVLFNEFVHKFRSQLEYLRVPELYWEILFKKTRFQIYDAEEWFDNQYIEYTEAAGMTPDLEDASPRHALKVKIARGISLSDPNAIFLIDHIWCFKPNRAQRNLETNLILTETMCQLCDVNIQDPDRIKKVLRRMWKYCNVYSERFEDPEWRLKWYVMDSVGCGAIHHDDPSFRVIPFMDFNRQMPYTIMYPIKRTRHGDYVTYNSLEFIRHSASEIQALLLPWRPTDFKSISYSQDEPRSESFSSLELDEQFSIPSTPEHKPIRRRFNVFTEYKEVKIYLRSPNFNIVNIEKDADIFWITRTYNAYDKILPTQYVNQFPLEHVVIMKNLLAIVARRVKNNHLKCNNFETLPLWLPTTFNLKKELIKFISYYQNRQSAGCDNHWILKSWNLARTIDIHVTDNLSKILKFRGDSTPRIVQKYIDCPVLFLRADLNQKVKFDMRFAVVLKCTRPLCIYFYHKFFVRFANKPFSLDNFDDFEKHFTVKKYNRTSTSHNVPCEVFVREWERQNPLFRWKDVYKDIGHLIYDLFYAACNCEPPRGIQPSPQSRALYTADIILEWRNNKTLIQPKLLEVNFMPDCQTACKYYPYFYNHVFKFLFLNDSKEFFHQLFPRS